MALTSGRHQSNHANSKGAGVKHRDGNASHGGKDKVHLSWPVQYRPNWIHLTVNIDSLPPSEVARMSIIDVEE